MPNPKPNPKTRFKAGQTGNPNGRPPVPEDIKASRSLNKVELERVFNEFIYMDRDTISQRAKDPKAPMLEIVVAKIIDEAIKRGDQVRLGFILDRLIGPVPKSVALSNEDQEGFVMVIKDYAEKK